MASKLVCILLLSSIGTYVSGVSVNGFYATLAPDTNTNSSFCDQLVEKSSNTTDIRLINYYWNAFHVLCRKDVRDKAERINKCVTAKPFARTTFKECRLASAVGNDCGTQVKALNCILDLVGAECGGDEAIIFTAFRMEFTLVMGTGAKADDCSVKVLQYRQKHPKPSPTSSVPSTTPLPTTQVPSKPELDHSCEIIESLANRTSDPEYFLRGSAQLLCDGNQTKKSVDETFKCAHQVERLPQYEAACENYTIDSELYCRSKPRLMPCLAKFIGGHCGGQPAIDILAFTFEFSFDLALSKWFKPRPKCADEFLAALRHLQTPRNH